MLCEEDLRIIGTLKETEIEPNGQLTPEHALSAPPEKPRRRLCKTSASSAVHISLRLDSVAKVLDEPELYYNITPLYINTERRRIQSHFAFKLGKMREDRFN